MTLDKVKVYLDGKMVVFATQTDVLIASVPPGQFRIKPTDGDGFAFEDLVNNKTIAAVKDYDDVLDAAGATYGANQAAVLTALNAFVGFKSGGGVGSDYIDEYFYSVNVTNADTYPYLVDTYSIPLDNAVSVEVDYIAYRTDSAALGKRQTLARYGGNDGGVISSPNQSTALTSSSYAVTASLVLNGSNIELQIDIAGGNLSYNFWVKVRKISK